MAAPLLKTSRYWVRATSSDYMTVLHSTRKVACRASGTDIRVGRNVFVNQNCTFYDLGGLDIADDVMIGPNVSLITSGHPLEPSGRRTTVVAKPIVIERNVWIAAAVTIIGGVTVGENSVVAAGSVVTRDVPPDTLVGGNPARVIRSIAE